MKSIIKKIIKIILTIAIIALAVWGALAGVKYFFFTGSPSTDIWTESNEYNPASANQLIKSDGEDFKILLLADIQLGSSISKDKKALEMVDELVKETDPDFIMTTGDNSYFALADFMTIRVIKQLESYGIPWSTTLGNHDTDSLADRNWLGNQYQNAENSLFEMGPSNIHGVGNYVINIVDTDGSVIYSLIVLDSHGDRDYAEGEDYDFIYYDQIKWYEWVVSAQSEVPSMLFFHIPLPEYAEAAAMLESGDLSDPNAFGENHEPVCDAPVNSGLFDKAVELGSTSHIFAGHDHINSLSVNYEGIRLTYGLKTGATCYSEEEMQGATLITIAGDTNQVTVEHIYK
ncbi:MAG: metallophosphoesterase [Eubacteriales bacterium]